MNRIWIFNECFVGIESDMSQKYKVNYPLKIIR